jgi:hypothetical protein
MRTLFTKTTEWGPLCSPFEELLRISTDHAARAADSSTRGMIGRAESRRRSGGA